MAELRDFQGQPRGRCEADFQAMDSSKDFKQQSGVGQIDSKGRKGSGKQKRFSFYAKQDLCFRCALTPQNIPMSPFHISQTL